MTFEDIKYLTYSGNIYYETSTLRYTVLLIISYMDSIKLEDM